MKAMSNARTHYQQNIRHINKETEEMNAVTEARNKVTQSALRYGMFVQHAMPIKCYNTDTGTIKVKISSTPNVNYKQKTEMHVAINIRPASRV